MIKLSLITLLIATSFISTLLAQDCNNPLLPFFGLPGLDAPQPGSGLPYCAALQSAETCCAADIVATFQDRLNGIVDRLNNYAAGKDLYLAQLRNRFLEKFIDIVEEIDADHLDELQTIRQANATRADELEGIINSARQILTNAQNVTDRFVAALDNFQKARRECFRTALEIQASAWCLACDPNYAAQGVGEDGSVTFGDGLCQAISDACNPYFRREAVFNRLVDARAEYWRLNATLRYLRDFAASGAVGDFVIGKDPYNPLLSQRSVAVPPLWNSPESAGAQSDGQCEYLWAEDGQLVTLLAIGAGAIGNAEQLFEEELMFGNGDESAEATNLGRLLQAAPPPPEGWNPQLPNAGLYYGALALDPGDYFLISDYSDYINQIADEADLTDL